MEETTMQEETQSQEVVPRYDESTKTLYLENAELSLKVTSDRNIWSKYEGEENYRLTGAQTPYMLYKQEKIIYLQNLRAMLLAKRRNQGRTPEQEEDGVEITIEGLEQEGGFEQENGKNYE